MIVCISVAVFFFVFGCYASYKATESMTTIRRQKEENRLNDDKVKQFLKDAEIKKASIDAQLPDVLMKTGCAVPLQKALNDVIFVFKSDDTRTKKIALIEFGRQAGDSHSKWQHLLMLLDDNDLRVIYDYLIHGLLVAPECERILKSKKTGEEHEK